MQYAYPFKHKRKEKVENYVSFLIVLPFDYYFLQWSNFVIIVQYVRNKKLKLSRYTPRGHLWGERRYSSY
jgi:hypothetical protein